ncbi:MAG: polysulfide reductase NrfD [Acidobacteriia bacterium]|nr:polysulfide reductase NrfD [Terriglobia bacterium]
MIAVTTDGRDIDLEVAKLSGEGALQKVRPVDTHMQRVAREWGKLPTPDTSDPTYYGRPVLKEPVWHWAIPLYFYVGGAAGASLVMGSAAQLDRSGELENLMRRCHWAGIIGSALSGAILIYDLGKPSRFHHMLRVFRPTSPMNMGAWILSSVSPSAIVAAMFAQRRGILGAFGEISGVASGLSGLALSTYTGVLIANSAIPVWQESRRVLPILFGASAMASAGSIFDMFFEDRAARRVTYTFGTVGRAAELAASIALERQAGRVPHVARPLHTGASGFLWKTATVMTAGSLLLSVLPGRSRKRRVAAGVMGTLGSIMMRYGIHQAGVASARDPRATFRQQRAGHGAAELD